nr:unnamed protein product [Digitaria exilis]
MLPLPVDPKLGFVVDHPLRPLSNPTNLQ